MRKVLRKIALAGVSLCLLTLAVDTAQAAEIVPEGTRLTATLSPGFAFPADGDTEAVLVLLLQPQELLPAHHLADVKWCSVRGLAVGNLEESRIEVTGEALYCGYADGHQAEILMPTTATGADGKPGVPAVIANGMLTPATRGLVFQTTDPIPLPLR